MHIGELAKKTGASIRSLRYYDQMGVLRATRQENGYRSYEPEAIEQVRKIRSLLALGFTLDDIQLLAPCFTQHVETSTPPRDTELAQFYQKIEEIDQHIKTLQDLRTNIERYLEAVSAAGGTHDDR